MARSERISLSEKLARFSERWSPRVVESLDDYEIKLVKIQGDFVWHSYTEADELFLVLEGAQAGLSWSTILHRREGYRRALSQFDPAKVARFNAALTPAEVRYLHGSYVASGFGQPAGSGSSRARPSMSTARTASSRSTRTKARGSD